MTTSTGSSRWQQLGGLLTSRRADLDPRFGGVHGRRLFCEATGLDYRLVYDIEEARRANFGKAARGALENGYRLEPGAIGRFTEGSTEGSGVLEVRAGATPARTAAASSAAARGGDGDQALRPWLALVRRELELAELRYGAGFTGTDAFPDSEAMAAVWDRPEIPEKAKMVLLALNRKDQDAKSDTGLAGMRNARLMRTMGKDSVTKRSPMWNVRTGRTHNST